MKRVEPKYVYRFFCAALLAVIPTIMFFFVWFKFVSANNPTQHLLGIGNLGMSMGLYLILDIVIGLEVRAFKIGVESKASTVASQILVLFFTDLIEVFLSLAITGQFRFIWKFLWRYAFLWIVQSIIVAILTVFMIDLYRKLFSPLQLLEVYGDHEDELTPKIEGVPYKYHIKSKRHYSELTIDSMLVDYDAVLINDVPAQYRNDILKICFENDKRVYFVPKISDILTKAADTLNIFDTPLYLSRNNGISAVQGIIKRAFDLVTSSIALIVLSPLFVITALAIKLDDGGPVFFKQERCTINGKKFMIYKFRSMIVDAEKDGRTHPAGENDDRITKVGKVIRAARIDELPQLINILKGDMSVVGPRPERVEHVQIYSELIREFPYRNKVKGGLTGYAQVYGKYNTSPLDKLKMDLIYITNYSFMLDLQIILETLKILLRKESTEGFNETKAQMMHDYIEEESNDKEER